MTLFAAIVKTMAEVHNKRLYHRDLKPANILLTAYGQPKIADFGLGWIAKPIEFNKTQGKTTMFQSTLLASGTPSYMSREHRLGKEAQADDDVYALGVMFYQMLTGKVGEMDRAWQKTLKGLQRAHYIDVIETALLDRGERFSDAGELLNALSSIQRPVSVASSENKTSQPASTAEQPVVSQLSISPAAKENDDFSWQQAKAKAAQHMKNQAFALAQEDIHSYLMDPTLRHRLHEEEALQVSLRIKRQQAEWEKQQVALKKAQVADENVRRSEISKQQQHPPQQSQRVSVSVQSVKQPPPQKSQLSPLTPMDIHGWSIAQVQAHQRKTAEFFKLNVVFQDVFKNGQSGPKMAVIPAGIFQMGSPDQEPGRQIHERQHQVTIAKPFALGIYAVSFTEYDLYAQVMKQPKPDDQGFGRGADR